MVGIAVTLQANSCFLMSKSEVFRRYTLFVFSVLVNAFSIAVITKALLGTSPISSVPYVLSLATPPTMGQYTIYMNFLFILLEMVLMKREEIVAKWYELASQVPITICFGLFIDFSMHILGWLDTSYYLSQILILLVGCFLLGTGISLEVKANVAMVTGEYLVQIISKFVRREFGFVKVCFDVTLVLIACTLSWIFLGRIEGVREGTIAAALLVGPVSHFMYPCWKIFDDWLHGVTDIREAESSRESYPLVITIAREYGSGGHLLGEMLAKELGIKFYDKALISMVAKESSLPETYVSENEQRMSSNALLNIILHDYEAPMERSLCKADALFVAQSRVIRQIAHQESCIIIGRLADYVLKDYPQDSIIRVFCYTDLQDACRRCTEEYQVDAKIVKTEIERINRLRISHYQYYTGQKWGDPHNYNLMINTGSMGLDMARKLVAQLYRQKLEGHPEA